MYTYLGKWIMVNNSKCESLSSLPTRGGSIPLQVTNSGSLLGAFPGLLLGAPKRALWHGLHSALASPGPCPAEIMHRLLGLRPVLRGAQTSQSRPVVATGQPWAPCCARAGRDRLLYRASLPR